MQTVKTAIVVVLLATVVYSAWVALTAPPAELPQELVGIVEGIDGGDFSLDDIDIGISDGESADAMQPPSIMAGDPGPGGPASAGDPTTSGNQSADLPPPLASSDTVSGASDYDPPETFELPAPDSAGGDSVPAASARLTDTDNSTPTNTANSTPPNLGYEIPPNSNSQPADQSGPGGFELPEDYSTGTTDSFAVAETPKTANDSAGSSDPKDVNDTQDVDDQENDSSSARTALANAIATADRQQQQDRLREALTTLSLFYNTPSLGPEERAAMLGRLDYLAGEVVYSKRHLLEQPYRVSRGETLETIAKSLDVPWQLLATINQVSDPAKIVPGQELKVVRGPFRAEVSLGRGELTLMLGEIYAGRFPLSVGQDPAPKPGDYTIRDKQKSRVYYTLGGANIPAGDDRNPYGDVWLDLGDRMCIHGSARSAASAEMGCIRLSPSDARDVFGILSKGSSVVITR